MVVYFGCLKLRSLNDSMKNDEELFEDFDRFANEVVVANSV